MGKTYRRNMNSVKGYDSENITKIEKTRKPIHPQNKPSKRYQCVTEGCYQSFIEYEAGHQYGQSHKTYHALNQTLNQKVRTIMKRNTKKEIEEELENMQ